MVFHDPKPSGGSFRSKLKPQPITITITTQTAKGAAPDEAVRTQAGSIPEDGPLRKPAPSDEAHRIFERARASSAFVTSPGRFRELWAALDECGVFNLPRWRSGIPPVDKPSIRMTAEGRTWIFLRPDVGGEDLQRREDIQKAQLAWRMAKIQIVGFVP